MNVYPVVACDPRVKVVSTARHCTEIRTRMEACCGSSEGMTMRGQTRTCRGIEPRASVRLYATWRVASCRRNAIGPLLEESRSTYAQWPVYDSGPQCRPVIFCHDEEEKRRAYVIVNKSIRRKYTISWTHDLALMGTGDVWHTYMLRPDPKPDQPSGNTAKNGEPREEPNDPRSR